MVKMERGMRWINQTASNERAGMVGAVIGWLAFGLSSDWLERPHLSM